MIIIKDMETEEGGKVGEDSLCAFKDGEEYGKRLCKCLFNDVDLGILGEPICFLLQWPLGHPGESIRSYKELMIGSKGIVGVWGVWKDYDTWD